MATKRTSGIPKVKKHGKDEAPIKINFDALPESERKKWIRFDGDFQHGDITGVRPFFTSDSHLVCRYNPEDQKYDLCDPVGVD